MQWVNRWLLLFRIVYVTSIYFLFQGRQFTARHEDVHLTLQLENAFKMPKKIGWLLQEMGVLKPMEQEPIIISVWPVDEPANIALFNIWRLTSTIYDVCIQCPMEVTVLFERNIRTIFLKQTY